MNKRLNQLQPYPFERLNELLANVTPKTDEDFISLALGEPKHRAPEFLIESYCNIETIAKSFGTYPPTKGLAFAKGNRFLARPAFPKPCPAFFPSTFPPAIEK